MRDSTAARPPRQRRYHGFNSGSPRTRGLLDMAGLLLAAVAAALAAGALSLLINMPMGGLATLSALSDAPDSGLAGPPTA